MANKDLYIGFDIGGTKCAVVGGTKDMDILERIQIANDTTKGPEHTISKLIENANSIIKENAAYTLLAGGVSCGGPLDSKQGLILSPPNLPGWDRINIVQRLGSELGIPVFLQNDANACALAEWRFGAGKGSENMIFLTFGTGLGAGLILNGKLYTGANDLAGEIGHIRLSDTGPMAYGKNGSFEAFCSGSGISRWAKELISEKHEIGENAGSWNSKAERITTKMLAEAANKGDEFSINLFRESAKYLGKGLAVLIDILNPELIVIGSVFARNQHLFEHDMLKVIRDEALTPANRVCKIVPAALADSVGDFASFSVAINGYETETNNK